MSIKFINRVRLYLINRIIKGKERTKDFKRDQKFNSDGHQLIIINKEKRILPQ